MLYNALLELYYIEYLYIYTKWKEETWKNGKKSK